MISLCKRKYIRFIYMVIIEFNFNIQDIFIFIFD